MYLFGRLDARDRAALVARLCRALQRRRRADAEVRREVRVGDVGVGAALDRVGDVGRGHLAVDRRAEVDALADVHGDRLAAVGDPAVGGRRDLGGQVRAERVGRVRRVDEQRPLRRVDRQRSPARSTPRPDRGARSPRWRDGQRAALLLAGERLAGRVLARLERDRCRAADALARPRDELLELLEPQAASPTASSPVTASGDQAARTTPHSVSSCVDGCARSRRSHAAHRVSPRGLSASSRPSPTRLNASTVSSSAAPGKTMYHQAVLKIGDGVGDHLAPARGRRPDPDAEERERRLEQDVGRDQQARVDDQRRHQVGQDLPEQDPRVRRAQRARRLDELLLAQRQHLPARDPRDVGEASDHDDEDDRRRARLDQAADAAAHAARRADPEARGPAPGTTGRRRRCARCSVSAQPR